MHGIEMRILNCLPKVNPSNRPKCAYRLFAAEAYIPTSLVIWFSRILVKGILAVMRKAIKWDRARKQSQV